MFIVDRYLADTHFLFGVWLQGHIERRGCRERVKGFQPEVQLAYSILGSGRRISKQALKLVLCRH